MKKIIGFTLLLFLVQTILAVPQFELDETVDYEIFEPRFFNLSTDGFLNNSLLTLAGIFVVGVILFELALYALDVYYNQTYLNRVDTRQDEYNAEYAGQLYSQTQYPKYYDYYQQTFRGRQAQGGWTANIAKIPQWLALAYQMYEASDDFLGDLDCQKRAICEVYQNQKSLGEVSKRARHSLDYLPSLALFSLPDELLSLVDEFTDAQSNGKSSQFQCQDLYACPESLLHLSQMYNEI